MIRFSLLILMTAFLLTACSSGKSAFRRGHFDQAVELASERLNQPRGWGKRGYELASLVLKDAFVRAYNQHQNTIRRLSSAPNSGAGPVPSFRWEAVFQEYEQLQTLTDNVRRGLTGRGTMPACADCAEWLAAYPTSYAEQQNEIRKLAAADRYLVAEQAFNFREEDRLAAKEAYVNYRRALDWIPDYQQAHAKSEEALAFAILRVVVEPLSPTRELSDRHNEELERLIFRQIGRDTAPSKFARLYAPDEQAGDGFPIHQAVQMQVTDYSPFDETITSSSTTVYSNQTYKVGEKKINDSTKVDIMEKVSGTLVTYRKEIRAGLDLRMRALDFQTGKVLWEEPVWESRSWVTEWQTFRGDDRALNGSSLKSADLFPPSRWSLYNGMRDDLAYDVAQRLRRRYAKD